MSGINSRLMYDSCAQAEKTKTVVAPGNYAMFLDNYVSPTLKSSVCISLVVLTSAEPNTSMAFSFIQLIYTVTAFLFSSLLILNLPD